MIKKAVNKSTLTGISASLSICWLFLQLSRLSEGPLSARHPVLFVPLAFSGLFSAVILLRFLIKKHSARVSAVMQASGAALGVLLAFFSPGAALAFIIAFVLMVFFFFTFIRNLSGTKAGTGAFALSAAVFVPLSLIYTRLLSPNLGGAALHTALSLLLPAASRIIYLAGRGLEEETAGDFAETSKSPPWIGLSVSLAGLLAAASRAAFIQSVLPAYMAETEIAGAAVFVLTLFFMLWLSRRGRAWQTLYTTLVSFALGALLSFAFGSFDQLFFTFLPLMLLFISGTGMLALFFDFCGRCASPVNRPAAFGAAYIAAYSLIGLYSGWASGSFALPDWLFTYAAVALTAAVLLMAPAILRGFPSRGEDEPSGKDAEPQPVSGADEDILDFGTLTKQLTNSEKKVFELILRGYSNQQIADELFISINTVKFHIRNVLAKIGVQRKSELLAVYAKRRQPEPEKQPK